jgi:hypothetical protein
MPCSFLTQSLTALFRTNRFSASDQFVLGLLFFHHQIWEQYLWLNNGTYTGQTNESGNLTECVQQVYILPFSVGGQRGLC